MPYNTAALPPREEPTGTTQLPVSRVKKMIQLDQDINACSSNATFVITLATEMFIQYMAEQGHNVVKSERKPRRNIQYKDLSSAVSRLDNLEFLSDIVPKTVPFSAIKAKKTKAATSSTTEPTTNGEGPSNSNSHPHGHNIQQTLLNGINGFAVRTGNGFVAGEEEEEEEGPEAQLERESKGRRVSVAIESVEGTISGGEDVEMH